MRKKTIQCLKEEQIEKLEIIHSKISIFDQKSRGQKRAFI